jgi:zinc resistance-associated protein
MTGSKQAIKIIFILSLGLFIIPGTSQADKMRGGGGYHMMSSDLMSQLTAEEQKTVTEVSKKYQGPMMELRKQLFAKHAELNAVMAQEKFDPKKARALSKEILTLRNKMMEQHMEMNIEMREKGVSYYSTCMTGGKMGRGMMMDDSMMDDDMMKQDMKQDMKQPAKK